jgi:hypothetical protein
VGFGIFRPEGGINRHTDRQLNRLTNGQTHVHWTHECIYSGPVVALDLHLNLNLGPKKRVRVRIPSKSFIKLRLSFFDSFDLL